MSTVRTAVLPAAGLGTRFLPATKSVPKELLPLLDRPVIDYIVAEAVEAGIERIVLVTSRGKDALADFFDRSPSLEAHLRSTGKLALLDRVLEVCSRAEVVTVRQRETLGLGHAVWCARAVVGDEPFAVLLGDEVIFSPTPALGQLLAVHAAAPDDHAVVALMEVPRALTRRYGICDGAWLDDMRMQVTAMIEKPEPEVAPSCHAIVGRYVLPPDIFDVLATTPPGSGGEIQLTDALAVLAGQGRVIGSRFSGIRHDTGNVLGLLRAAMFAAAARPDLQDEFAKILAEVSTIIRDRA
ncbi:MAG: UTP--glucose-1-phosphate uridylyltransferase [Myxococcota bacterium]|jgi:UTP--glucose-1-phosphate uridylyltransferase